MISSVTLSSIEDGVRLLPTVKAQVISKREYACLCSGRGKVGVTTFAHGARIERARAGQGAREL